MKRYFNSKTNFEKIIKEKVDILEINKIESAWTNFVYKVKTKEDILLFRFPRNTFFKKALEKEIFVSNYLFNKINFKTNKLEKCTYKNKIYSMHKFIKGESLTKCYESFTTEDIENFAKQLSSFLYKLSSQDNLKLKIPKLSSFLIELTKSNKYSFFDKYIFEKLVYLEKEKSIVVHGDLNPGNIIIKNNKIEAIIDFAFCGISTPLVDISRIIGRLPKIFKDPIIKEYEEKFNTTVKEEDLSYLINLWSYVEKNYIKYIQKECKDIVLPKFFN